MHTTLTILVGLGFAASRLIRWALLWAGLRSAMKRGSCGYRLVFYYTYEPSLGLNNAYEPHGRLPFRIVRPPVDVAGSSRSRSGAMAGQKNPGA